MSPIHRGLVAVAVAILLALAPAAAQAKKAKQPKQQVNVTIDQQGLEGRPQAVASAWMGYGLGRANWLSEHVVGKKDPQPYRRSFEEEVAGRETLAKIWSELKQSDPEARDAYLDALARVLESGFLREYVWVYLKAPEWPAAPPPGLRLGEFATWRESNLAAHEVETFADVTIVGKAK